MGSQGERRGKQCPPGTLRQGRAGPHPGPASRRHRAVAGHRTPASATCRRPAVRLSPRQRLLPRRLPERLVRIRAGEALTHALAGTIARGGDAQEDARLGQALLDSAKDRHEHQLVVEAIRTALEPFSEVLEIPDAPGLKRLARVQHLNTPIRARLADAGGILRLLQALHPTPRWAATHAARRWTTSASTKGWTAAGTPRRWAGSTAKATAISWWRCARPCSRRAGATCSPAAVW